MVASAQERLTPQCDAGKLHGLTRIKRPGSCEVVGSPLSQPESMKLMSLLTTQRIMALVHEYDLSVPRS